MKQSIRCTLLIAFLLLPVGGALGQSANTTAKKPTTQEVFQGLIDRYYTTWNSGDPEKAAPLYAKDPDLVFFDLTPLKYTGWAEYDVGVRKVMASFASVSFTPQKDLRVTRRGSIAWTTVTFHMSGKKATGEAVEMNGRQTLIWENRGGNWLIVHEHFSVPLG
jgi:uncharacterized protein (TIGR02246 family)